MRRLGLTLLLLSPLLLGLCLPLPSRAATDPPQVPLLRVAGGGHLAAGPRLSLDRSARLRATASYDKTVRLWSLDDDSQLAVLRPPIGEGEEGAIYAVALTPDGRRAYAAGATGGQWDGTFCIYVFDTEHVLDTGQTRLVGRLPGLPAPVNDLALSADGGLLAVGPELRRTDPRAGLGRRSAVRDVSGRACARLQRCRPHARGYACRPRPASLGRGGVA